MLRKLLVTSLLVVGGLLVTVAPAGAAAGCFQWDASTPCNWHTGVDYGNGYFVSPYVWMNGGGNGNFSINVSGGNTFQGCDASSGACDAPIYIHGGTTGPLFRGAPVHNWMVAYQESGGAEDTTLYFPYP